MSLTVLSVAYPLAPVGADCVGGAEQIVARLDRALVAAGHRSLVLACAGSRVAGTLIAVPRLTGELHASAIAAARGHHREAIREALRHTAIDVVHMHGVDFHAYLPPPGPPVLVSLHLPIACYPPEALPPRRADTYLQCVSRAQHASALGIKGLIAPIENGVELGPAEPLRKGEFALMLCRMCPEKGVHIAIEAAKRARVPLLIAGEVFRYPDHERYFAEQIAPRLDGLRRFIGPVRGRRKQQLLARARALIVASTIAETSSLAAREALAAGTPVVALHSPALADIIAHGSNGYLVGNEQDLAEAIVAAPGIDPQRCRAAAARWSAQRMAARYLKLYGHLAHRGQARNALLAS